MADKPDDRNGNWREKYLNALDHQEQLERENNAQQELLRRALVRVSVAADGQDDALDAVLGNLRERMRGALSGDINNLLARLDQTVLSFEEQRSKNALDVRESIAATLRPLQQLELSRAIKKEISQFLAQLPERASKVRLYPALLEQLASLQQQALKEIEQPKRGFLQKILGDKTPDAPKSPAATAEKIPDETLAEPDGNVVAPQKISTAPTESGNAINTFATPQAQPLSGQLLQAELPPAFVTNVNHIINQFLAGLDSETPLLKKVQALHLRFSSEMSVTTFIETLEHLRDLVMHAYLASNRAFATYLQNVNQELADIYNLVGGSKNSVSSQRHASSAMQSSVMQGMAALAANADSATDLTDLKMQVKSQLGNIRQALDQYQQAEQMQDQLADQLEALGEKIKLMESEAEKNRTVLERQRYKALHDPLTELPNREFYNERAAYELQRWQRYNRPLTMAVFDIDHFKKINDSYGHQAGDRVLKVIGRSIAKRLREVDFFCRFGGEEFIALMPETSVDEALPALEKIRAAVADAAFNYKDQPIAITLSIGVTEFKSGDDIEAAFARADQALYNAKSQGRNCLRSS